jgi:hypothetical protein
VGILKGILFAREKVRFCDLTGTSYANDIHSYSVLPALSLDGVIHVKVVEDAFNMQMLNEFINELLDKMNP